MRRTVILTLLLFLLCGGSHAVAPDLAAFASVFDAEGFVVQEGKLETYDVAAMVDAGLAPSCYANNPTAPYMVYKLPKGPGQTVNNTITDAPIRPENRGLWVDNRLRQDEVLVLFGETPPACAYFSYRTYLANRFFPGDPFGDGGAARRVFASLGDTINNLDVRLADGTAGPFNGSVIVVSAANRKSAARVHAVLERTGFPAERVNDDVVPAALVRMGFNERDDSFMLLHRVALFQDAAAGEAYMNRSFPVLRLTPKTVMPADPFPVPTLAVRGSGNTSEIDLLPALDRLRDAILARHGTEKATEPETSIWIGEGYDGIQRGIDVLGEVRDTVYLRTGEFVLGQDDVAVFYGVNHAATGRARYANLGVYGTRLLNGLAGVSDREFGNTAGEYLPGDPAAPLLYVWTLSRKPGTANTTVVPTVPGARGIPLDEPLFAGFRAYQDPATGVGPLWAELAYDRVIVFDGREPGGGPSSTVPPTTPGPGPTGRERPYRPASPWAGA